MYFEEQSRDLIERADYLLRKSRLIQQKADGASKNFHKVVQANDDLIALLESCRHLPQRGSIRRTCSKYQIVKRSADKQHSIDVKR